MAHMVEHEDDIAAVQGHVLGGPALQANLVAVPQPTVGATEQLHHKARTVTDMPCVDT